MLIEKLILSVVGFACSLLVMIALQPIFYNACSESCSSPIVSAIVLSVSIAASLVLIWFVRWETATVLKSKCYFFFAVLFLGAGFAGIVFIPHNRPLASINILLAVIFYVVSVKSNGSRND
jgi:hypothetical protein